MGKKGKIKKQIFLEKLPQKGYIDNRIDWIESVGFVVHFIYDDTEGDLEIIEYMGNNKIKVKYKNNDYIILTTSLLKCGIGRILRESMPKLKIGDNIKDDKRNLTIIDEEIRIVKGVSYKFYKYHCNKCNGESWIRKGHLESGKGCSICCKSPRKVVKGINDIATTNPEMIKYFVNIDDVYNCTKSSGKTTLAKCPCCGFERMYRINDLYSKGFSCPKCNIKDGFSFPEKFMTNVLDRLKENGQLNYYKCQYTKVNAKWCGRYKYDFYFELNDKKYIIETHGEQHYVDINRKGGRTLEEEQENDKVKEQLALKNGIDEYITLDCRRTDLNFIKNSIMNSKLNDLFDLSSINWELCCINSRSNKVKEVCDYWHLHNEINNENIYIVDLAKIFNVSTTTITNYLKQGTEIEWCNYHPKQCKTK